MEEYLKKDFGKILKSQGLEARRWMKNTDSDVCRVYDRSLEELELTVDLYGPYARIMDYALDPRNEDEITEIIDIVSRFLYVEREKVIWKERKKREGREQHEKGDEECPVIVKENGLLFECELKKYADTGLFLDMAENRRLLMEMSQNQRVLNLFSYTSSFSVYAAKGGAESVESVDLSNVYTAWSRRNLERNGFLDENKYKVVAEDARSFLERALEPTEKSLSEREYLSASSLKTYPSCCNVDRNLRRVAFGRSVSFASDSRFSSPFLERTSNIFIVRLTPLIIFFSSSSLTAIINPRSSAEHY